MLKMRPAMKNFTIILLVTVGLVFSYEANAQRTISPPEPGTNTITSADREGKSEEFDKFIDHQYKRVQATLLGKAVGNDVVQVFHADDVDAYLNVFRSAPMADQRVDEAVARERIQDVVSGADQLLARLKGAQQVNLLKNEFSPSNNERPINFLTMLVEVIDKSDHPYIAQLTLAEINGAYRLLSAVEQ